MFTNKNVACTKCHGTIFYIYYVRDRNNQIVPDCAMCISCRHESKGIKTVIKPLESQMLKNEGIVVSAHGVRYQAAIAGMRAALFNLQTEFDPYSLSTNSLYAPES